MTTTKLPPPFQTFQEYVDRYPGLGTIREFEKTSCPHCDAPRDHTTYLGHHWLSGDIRCDDCGHKFNDWKRETIRKPMTDSLEEWVMKQINGHYKIALQLSSALAPAPPRYGVLDAAAQIGMYSSDPTRARESIVYTVQSQLRKASQERVRNQHLSDQRRWIEQVYQELLWQAEQYFHGEELRAAQQRAEEAAQEQRDAQARHAADILADAIVRRLQST